MNIQVTSGTFAEIDAQALLCLVPQFGPYNGTVDRMLYATYANLYHNQLYEYTPLQIGQIIVADGETPRAMKVMFVVYGPNKSLVRALEQCQRNGFKKVVIPVEMFRAGITGIFKWTYKYCAEFIKFDLDEIQRRYPRNGMEVFVLAPETQIVVITEALK